MPFNNMRTVKFKAQPTNAFFATVNQMVGSSSQLPMLSELCSTICFDYCALGSSRKLGGAAEHLIDGSEKRICQLSFEFYSPHVIERRSKETKTFELTINCCLYAVVTPTLQAIRICRV